MQEQHGEPAYIAAGNVNFHGVTKRLEDSLFIRWLDKATLEIRGETRIDVQDFKMDPPKLLILRMDPVVRVKLKLILRRV